MSLEAKTTENGDYARQVCEFLPTATYEKALEIYQLVLNDPHLDDYVIAQMGRYDRYFLFTMMLRRADAFHPWLYERCREVEGETDDCLDLWARGHYKAVDINELVPVPMGWKKHGDLEPNDDVYGPDGQLTKVIGRTNIFEDADCYRVTFCDGYSVVVSGDHLWAVSISSRARIDGNIREKWQNVIFNTQALKCQVDCSETTLSRPYPKIDVAAAIYRPNKNLPIDPYVLGVWLGDGTNGGSSITSGFDDADEMQSLLSEKIEVNRRKHSNCISLRLGNGVKSKKGSSDFLNALRALGIYKDKRIPNIYLLSSVPQRFELLQGLMDTDGSCHKKHSQCIFVSAKKKLAGDAFSLCQSLGLKATWGMYTGEYKGERRPFWQVQFRGFAENPPFKLKRKVDICKLSFGITPHRKVKSVENVESIPVSCIEVLRPDGLYLIGESYIPTHNSSFITFAGSFQEMIKDSEITIGIFSHNRPIAKAFLDQIKVECETNESLSRYYPDIFWKNPKKDSPSWSLDSGITMIRQTNPKEKTIEAWGLVDSQPVSKHFDLRIYNDVVTMDSVATAEMILKTTERWELSQNLAKTEFVEGEKPGRQWHEGTRYSFGDTYGILLIRKALKPRLYPATDNGLPDGNPVFLTEAAWKRKKQAESPKTIATQQLQNPLAGEEQEFKPEWIRRYEVRPETLNVGITVDPASSKKKGSSNTAFAVIGLDRAHNKYLLDGACHKMALAEKWSTLKNLRRKWLNQPGIQTVSVGYEKYALQTDDEYFYEKMEIEDEAFPIQELSWPRDDTNAKDDRIRRLIPDHQNWQFFYPWEPKKQSLKRRDDDRRSGQERRKEESPISFKERRSPLNRRKGLLDTPKQRKADEQHKSYLISKPIKRRNEDGQFYNLVEWFIANEYMFFPATTSKDFLDAMSRIYDLDINPPIIYEETDLLPPAELFGS